MKETNLQDGESEPSKSQDLIGNIPKRKSASQGLAQDNYRLDILDSYTDSASDHHSIGSISEQNLAGKENSQNEGRYTKPMTLLGADSFSKPKKPNSTSRSNLKEDTNNQSRTEISDTEPITSQLKGVVQANRQQSKQTNSGKTINQGAPDVKDHIAKDYNGEIRKIPKEPFRINLEVIMKGKMPVKSSLGSKIEDASIKKTERTADFNAIKKNETNEDGDNFVLGDSLLEEIDKAVGANIDNQLNKIFGEEDAPNDFELQPLKFQNSSESQKNIHQAIQRKPTNFAMAGRRENKHLEEEEKYLDAQEAVPQIPISSIDLKKYDERTDYPRVLFIPLNGLFNIFAGNMSNSYRFGRNNYTNHPNFLMLPTLVVSRNHMEIFTIDGQDIGSNGGTFVNNKRLNDPGIPSENILLKTGDLIQLGKDHLEDAANLDENGRIQERKRCVRFQVLIIPSGERASDAVANQSVTILQPVNRGNPPQISQNIVEIENINENTNKITTKELAALVTEGIKPPAIKKQYILSQIFSGNKTSKLSLSEVDGKIAVSVNLKNWYESSRISMEIHEKESLVDIFLRINPGSKNPIKLKNYYGKVPWVAENSNAQLLGKIILQSEIKMEAFTSKKYSDPPTISVTGDFKEQRLMLIQKFERSREQKLIGESKGRHQTKKSVREQQYLANLEILETEDFELILGAVLLSNLLFSTP